MLKIFDLKKNKNKLKKQYEIYKGDYIGHIRHYLPANKEWFNSVYDFNKNSIKLLPSLDYIIIKIIKSYFYMFNSKLEKKIKLPALKKWKRRLSIRKIWVSKCELKHSNEKIIITLYIYNRQYNYLYNKALKVIYEYSFYKTINILKQQLKSLSKIKEHINIDNNLWNNLKKTFIIMLVTKYFKKEILYLKYKQIMLFNNLKFKNRYILPLKNFLYNIYKKQIEFNLVTLKNFHFNSDIFTQVLASKIRNRKNKAIRVLKASIFRIKTPILNQKTIKRESSVKLIKLINTQNLTINDFIRNKNIKNKNYLDKFLKDKLFYNNKELQDTVIDSIKLKTVIGIRVKASGRITRRIKAERAIYKLRSVGTLKNINSSYRGLSSIMVRNNQKSNIQYTSLKSRTQSKIGSFGLKSWVSGY